MAKSAVSIAGWVYSVRFSFSSASLASSLVRLLRSTNEERDSPSSTSTIVSSAWRQTSCTAEKRIQRSWVMPTYWLPCPGYMWATLACDGIAGLSVIMMPCAARKPQRDGSESDEAAKPLRFSNSAHVVDTTARRTDAPESNPEDQSEKTADKRCPRGSSSKVGPTTESPASRSETASTLSPDSSKTPPSTALSEA